MSRGPDKSRLVRARMLKLMGPQGAFCGPQEAAVVTFPCVGAFTWALTRSTIREWEARLGSDQVERLARDALTLAESGRRPKRLAGNMEAAVFRWIEQQFAEKRRGSSAVTEEKPPGSLAGPGTSTP